MCIAYIDPGNLEADLQTGATTGYQLLWVLLWSTAMGGLLQSLAARLGVATGKHLAEHCREQYPPGVRHVLWLMAEMAIIGSDIQEVIGTALALLLLSGGAMPLWAGVLVAAASAYLMLFLERLGVRYLEVLFELLIAVMSVSMGLLFFHVDIPYPEVLRGLAVPSLSRSAIPTACGLLGAIIMPHNLFLHSALVHSRPIEGSGRSGVPMRRSDSAKRESVLYYNIESGLALVVTLFINVAVISIYARGFFGRKTSEEIGLANAGEYLGSTFGKQMAIIWAVGLLAAGQSSTMTGTYAGQWVMGGFLDLKLSTGLRMLVTRGVAICPTLFVALSARSDSTRLDVLNQWINILQSVQLPFAVIPLLLFTSDKRVMGSRFVNSRGTTVLCWMIAASIITINASTAFETLAPLVHSAAYLHAVFVAVVAVYVGFLTYLVLTPEGAQRLAATISRNVSRLSLLGSAAGNSSSGSLTAAGGGGHAAGESAPYTPSVLPVCKSSVDYNATAPLTTCADSRLNGAEAIACLTCLSIRDRRKCLAQNAITRHGTDSDSCAWVGKNGMTREMEVKFSLGVAAPNSRAFMFAPSTCNLDIEVEYDNIHTPAIMCTLARDRKRCSTTLTVPKQASCAVSVVTAWTDRLALVEAWRKSNASCANTPEGVCSAYGSPYNFNYNLRIKERRCQRGALNPTTGVFPMAQPESVMAPGGLAFGAYRRLQFYTTELVADLACRDSTYFKICDYTQLQDGLGYCLGTDCKKDIKIDPARKEPLFLTIAYPKYSYTPGTYWFNATETPTQQIEIKELNVWPAA
ncbi:metal transporter Nramp3 [Chlorella sorokiniana]|uniref:Metal transporter Nramp3 n=1 Tax=Chlorella sorokiniana TaxID=3076 RepID=A0A2P6TKK9_CHLSO|nr:metal transporter Nramp3 [Chlorella sorokiniana]|eukprot:PRW44606.1 metal transporter Nramp3 [Chlorella sorokiniana]